MGTQIINWIATNWLFITLVLGFLTWIVKQTKWEWDDKVIEFIKRMLNLLFPGKKLYTSKDFEEKSIEQLREEEKEYNSKLPTKRIKEEVVKKFRKNK